ncbi:uncharacterized protein LOC126883416 [Diabrotica virgifera virgifera]|uniref:Endonuclease/exonuclease/phosphatase domain-containing protein n=1 Tax=Diabrotica virgifera virgifera TaxID=50390 RepID=A0ABM5K3Z7_DIAVI|nr:uncharacterized protein LOC126883416 [Diabrotica virgifera virgifera]
MNVSYTHYSIIIFNETWLTCNYADEELQLFDLNVYRTDRSSETSSFSRGGGVLIAVHKGLSSRSLKVNGTIEQLFVLVTEGANQFIIGTAYFPPKSTLDKYSIFCETLEKIAEDYPSAHYYLAADINLPNCEWFSNDMCSSTIPLPGATASEVEALQVVTGMCAYHNLFQSNTIVNATGNILDLVLVDDADVTVSRANEALLREGMHHPPLEFEIKMTKRRPNDGGLVSDGFYRDFKSADYVKITDFLSQFCWDNLFLGKTLNQIVNIFYDIVYLAIELFIPLKRYSKRRFPPWFSLELKNRIVEKKKAHKKYLLSKSVLDYQTFSQLRANCKLLKAESYRNHIYLTELSIRNNLKGFWSFVNSRRGKPSMPAVLRYGGVESGHGPDIILTEPKMNQTGNDPNRK